MLVISLPDQARATVRATPIISGRKSIESEHITAAKCQLVERGAPYAADSEHDHVEC